MKKTQFSKETLMTNPNNCNSILETHAALKVMQYMLVWEKQIEITSHIRRKILYQMTSFYLIWSHKYFPLIRITKHLHFFSFDSHCLAKVCSITEWIS